MKTRNKPGLYDPPNKWAIIHADRHIHSLGQLVVAASPYKQFSQFKEDSGGASHASKEINMKTENSSSIKRGRKSIVSPERLKVLFEAIRKGASEKAACLKAGISVSAWSAAKRTKEEIRKGLQAAKLAWADLRYGSHVAALFSSQSMRSATHKAKRPKPTHQAKLVQWHLTYRVPLNFVAFSPEQEKEACERFNYCLDQWNRQKTAFGLMQKIYKKRAELRGQATTSSGTSPFRNLSNWQSSHTPTYGVGNNDFDRGL